MKLARIDGSPLAQPVTLPSALYHSFLKLEFRARSPTENAPEKSATLAELSGVLFLLCYVCSRKYRSQHFLLMVFVPVSQARRELSLMPVLRAKAARLRPACCRRA